MQRRAGVSRATGRFRKRAVELELENIGQEVARVGNVGGYVIFGARIEELVRAGLGRGYALLFQA